MINIKFGLYGLFLIFIVSLVSAAGVNYPSPTEIQLTPGESERFTVGLQTSQDSPETCTFDITDSAGLNIEFDEDSVDLLGGKKDVFGTVTAPEEITNGKKTAKFCVICSPKVAPDSPPGSGVRFNNCGPTINVEIVGSRTRENLPQIPEKEQPTIQLSQIPIYYYLLIIAILIILIIWYLKGKKQPK